MIMRGNPLTCRNTKKIYNFKHYCIFTRFTRNSFLYF